MSNVKDNRNWLARGVDAIYDTIAPVSAARRNQARRYLNQYESGGPATRLTNVKKSVGTGDSLLDIAGKTIRERARWLDENHDVAIGILNVLVDNIVGTGICVEPQVKNMDGSLNTEMNKRLTALHDEWSKKPEVTWQHDLASSERLSCIHWLRDGEMLGQLVRGQGRGLDHGTQVPFSIELIEPDFLPLDYNDTSKRIRQGIERNAWGRPVAYHLYKVHPEDSINGFSISALMDPKSMKRVPADNIVFLRNSRRVSQMRGVSIFNSVISRLGDVKQYEDFERVAAQVAAALTVFISRNIEADCPEFLSNDLRNAPLRQLAPGMVLEGAPGEEPRVIQSGRPSNQILEFRKSNLRAVSSGTGAGYSSISKDYEGNYSSQRQELVEQNRHYLGLRGYFTARWSAPVYASFVQTAMLAGLLDRQMKGVDLATLTDALFLGPPMPWVDPLKEVSALEKEINVLGIKSRTQAIRERGGKPHEVGQQIESDEANLPMPAIAMPPPPPEFEDDDAGPPTSKGKKPVKEKTSED